MTEHIRLEHAFDALQDRRHAFESHAGIDRRTRQRHALLRRHLLELHDNQIPESEKAVAILLRAAGRTAPDMLAAVDENLRTGSAGSAVAHLPEIVRGRDTDDAVFREAGNFLPESKRIVVVVIDGNE